MSRKLVTTGAYSPDPKQQARQTAELEQRAKTALGNTDKDVAALEARVDSLEAALTALTARVVALEP
jgi:uncharacterized protein involved in exopolysaccharide biosynthesis